MFPLCFTPCCHAPEAHLSVISAAAGQLGQAEEMGFDAVLSPTQSDESLAQGRKGDWPLDTIVVSKQLLCCCGR